MSNDVSDALPYINTTDASFDHDVMVQSHQRLVVVDFWAEWCQPCRMLAPILERVCLEKREQVQLVKAKVEENQRSSGEFQVDGIPAVFAVWKGKVVDFFAGVMPESTLRQWIHRAAHDVALHRARDLEEKDPAAALSMYESLVTEYPDDAPAKIGLGRAYLALGDLTECQVIIDKLETRGFLETEAQRLKSALVLKTQPQVNLDRLRRSADEDPTNLSARLALAKALAGSGEHEESLSICLSIIQEDRRGIGEDARLWMLEVFRTLPADSDLLRSYRRKLASALY